MSSTNKGKAEVVKYIKSKFGRGGTCLDVGACDGKWANLLGDFLTMDGIEIFPENVIKYKLWEKYENITIGDVISFPHGDYNIIIFGDVIEHMSVEDAQDVLDYALDHSAMVIVGVPFMYKQGEMYGNKYEKHIQDDLTNEVFLERYDGFEPLILFDDYGYYKSR